MEGCSIPLTKNLTTTVVSVAKVTAGVNSEKVCIPNEVLVTPISVPEAVPNITLMSSATIFLKALEMSTLIFCPPSIVPLLADTEEITKFTGLSN